MLRQVRPRALRSTWQARALLLPRWYGTGWEDDHDDDDDDGERAAAFGMTVPLGRRAIDRLREARASVEVVGSGLDAFCHVSLIQNSHAHLTFVIICKEQNDRTAFRGAIPDPVVTLTPPTSVLGGPPVAPAVDHPNILKEAGAVVLAYAEVTDPDRLPNQVGRPRLLPDRGVPFRNSPVMARDLIRRLVSGRRCPTIVRQHRGTVLCGIHFNYVNACVSMQVVRGLRGTPRDILAN